MNTIPIDDINAFELVACDILEDFVYNFSIENGCLKLSGKLLVLTEKGNNLYERYVKRLYKVGEKMFPNETGYISIKAWSLIED